MSLVAGMSWAGVSASVDRHLAGRQAAAIWFSRSPVFRAPSSGLPYSGVIPRGRSDELEMDRPGRPRGAGAAARSIPSVGRGGRSPPSPLSPVRPSVFAPISGGAVTHRSPLLAKANLADGAQAAVVKLASYGSGSTRAAALLGYQSHHGGLALEPQDGTMVVGAQEVADVAASWEGSQRAPSNDVLSFRMTIEGSLTREEAQAGLEEALRGHAYAWAYAHEGEAAHVDVVMVAASTQRGAKGHLERVYANEKSVAGLHARLEAVFGGWPNDFGEPRWGHGIEGATTALARMTRAGEIEAYMPDGRTVRDEANTMWQGRPSAAGRSAPDDLNPSLEIAKSWESEMRSRRPRDFAHIILSAKAGTDKEAFMDAARATLAKEFAGHEYVFVMHTNRDHIHVHAAVRLTRSDGERLDPKIQHFARWRDTLAHEARERHIPMENVRRFDQAHAPAYELKDVRMMERGEAPPSVRRRIERVRDREVHHPTRPEGRQRAEEAAREWRAVAGERAYSELPPAAAGALRLYRFERGEISTHRNVLFTTDRTLAESYAKHGGHGRMVYVDVPADRISDLTPTRSQPDRLFVAPRSIAERSRPLDSETAVLSFRARAEAALGRSERSTTSETKETRGMRNVETMTASRNRMADLIGQIEATLPGDEAKEIFGERAKRLLETADGVIAEQARLERHRADVQGDRYVKPEPVQGLAGIITHERKGDEIHYRRHDATGAYQTLAFVDRGKEIDVHDWNNLSSINAALAVASRKWEAVTINGTDEYKEKAARLAAEHAYKIVNPELQDRIREMRAEIDAQRAQDAESERRSGAKPDEFGRPGARSDTDAEANREQKLADRARATREQMAEAKLLRREIASYRDDIAETTDDRYRDLPIERLARAEERLEAFLSKPIEPNSEGADEARSGRTPVEQDMRLQDIRGRIDREAEREAHEADRARAAHETNAAKGSEQTPYRSSEEARSARDAERSIDNDSHRPVLPDARQSEEMSNLTRRQRRLLEEEVEQRRIDAENAARANREYQRSRHEESEGE